MNNIQKRFEGKTVLITGGSSGIGMATAVRFAQEGANIAIHDIASCEETLKKIGGNGGKYRSYKVDVSKSNEVRKEIEHTIDDFERIDILINNAGISRSKDMLQYTDEDWERILGVNLTGAWNYIRYLSPHMANIGGGSIINVVSTSVPIPSYRKTPYVCSKSALLSLTGDAALNLAQYHIRVNAVLPGPIQTALNHRNGKFLGSPGGNALTLAIVPMHRWGKPEEIAGPIAFLASEDASFITGASLVIDGGRTAGGPEGMPWMLVPEPGAHIPWLEEILKNNLPEQKEV